MVVAFFKIIFGGDIVVVFVFVRWLSEVFNTSYKNSTQPVFL